MCSCPEQKSMLMDDNGFIVDSCRYFWLSRRGKTNKAKMLHCEIEYVAGKKLPYIEISLEENAKLGSKWLLLLYLEMALALSSLNEKEFQDAMDSTWNILARNPDEIDAQRESVKLLLGIKD